MNSLKINKGIKKMMRLFCCVLLFIFLSAVNFCLVVAQNKVDEAKPNPPTYKVTKLKGIDARFIVTIISDGNGGAWISTECDGFYHFAKDKKPTHFSQNVYDPNKITNRIPNNNAYALATDKLGRLWIGHLNVGVSIFHNNKFQLYDIADGPIGDRIFDIEICPVDGDVWLATSGGITRYRQKQDTWQHFTKADGLPESQIAAIAFKNDGTLIVGSQCYGLSIFNRDKKSEYKLAKNISAPHRFGTDKRSPVPLLWAGSGLPSNQINDIIVTKNSTVDKEQRIWIATSAGLVQSDIALKQLYYWRGKDYADKIRGLYGGAPKEFQPAPPEIIDTRLLPEDYITSLAEDAAGNLIYGTRTKGCVIFNPKTNERIFCNNKSVNLPDNYITAICPLPNGQYLLGSYGAGIVSLQKTDTTISETTQISETKIEQVNIAGTNTAATSDFPSPQKALTFDDLQKLSYTLAATSKKLPATYAAYWADDYKTESAWLGRISNEWGILCAMSAPLDRYVYHSRDFYNVTGFIGPNHGANDDLRRWVYRLKTDDFRALYDPLNGYRRFAEWDDHGEAYVWSKDGPDLWYVLEIKHSGVFRLGMYFVNMDGHEHNNRFRDYLIEIYPSEKGYSEVDSDRHVLGKYAEAQAVKVTPLVKTRVKDFWHGTYKQFIVNGPAKYLVKIDRNYSFNTIMSGIFVQQIHGKPTKDTKFGIPKLHCKYQPPQFPDYFEDAENEFLLEFWEMLDNKWINADAIDLQWKYRIAVYAASTRGAKE
ncbi:MAG: hypothetical protein LBC74_10885 [Planctomycetaceae bacterium]|nr:hypothetical protein [Planctomycetaceae bacterium]